MKKLDGKKMDALLCEEALAGMDIKEHLEKQTRLLGNLEDSEEFIGRMEAVAGATISMIKSQPSSDAMGCLMSGLVEAFCIGVEVGQECQVDEGVEVIQ